MPQQWSYRVVRKKEDSGEVSFGIHEVYYDKHGKPQFCSNGSIEPIGESVRALKTELSRMQKAFCQPILKYEDF